MRHRKKLKKPTKDNSIFKLNTKLHEEQNDDLWNKLQNEMKNVRFLEIKSPLLKPIDKELLLRDLNAAENYHPFVDKAVKMWKSIPLKSVHGLEGKQGNDGGGINNSPDPDKFLYTKAMQHCPHIKEIVESFGAPILKVRLMKLDGNRTLPEHVDQFRDHRILRFHIPIVTNEKVLFHIDKHPCHFPSGSLWFADVRKHHKVENGSKQFRVHIVIDVWMNDYFIEKIMLPSLNISDGIR